MKHKNSRPAVSIIIEKRQPKKDDYYPVKIRITQLQKTRYYGIDTKRMNDRLVDLDLKEFQYQGKGHFAIKEKDYTSAKNAQRDGKYKRLWDKFQEEVIEVDNMIKNMDVFNFEKFAENYFTRKGAGNSGEEKNVFDCFEEYIHTLEARGQIKTSDSYRTTLNALKEFTRKQKLSFYSITETFLVRFEKHIVNRNKSGKKSNSRATVGVYMRNLRSIFNRYTKNLKIDYPFGKGKYEIPAPQGKKIALDKEDLGKIYKYSPEQETTEAYYYNIWKLLYLMNGLNPVDLCNLRYMDIKDGFIYFLRRKSQRTNKTQEPIKIHYNGNIKEIIEMYGQKPPSPHKFIFPVFTNSMSERRKREVLELFIRKIDKYVGRVAKKIGIQRRVTVQTSRHSWATYAAKQNVPVDFIRRQLGHTKLETTLNYLGSFNQDEIIDLQNKTINFD
jgi:integrase/recombinase XerD